MGSQGRDERRQTLWDGGRHPLSRSGSGDDAPNRRFFDVLVRNEEGSHKESLG